MPMQDDELMRVADASNMLPFGMWSTQLMFELASSKVFSIDSFGYHGSGSDRSLQGHNCHVLSWTCDATQAEVRTVLDTH